MESTRSTGRLGTIGCALAAAFFLGHAGFALLQPEYYKGSTVHLLRYVVVPGGLGLAFLALLPLRRPGLKLHLSLNTLAVVVALYGVELYLTHLFLKGSVRAEAGQATLFPKDTHWAWTPWRINRALGSPSIQDAVLGHLPRERIRLCASDDGAVVIETDRHGLNNPDDLYRSPVDAAVVGDSFAHGFCQPPGRDLVGRLREQHPQVMNAALTGSGPVIEHALIGRYLRPLRPEKVLLCFYEGNDLKDLRAELGSPKEGWITDAAHSAAPAFGPSDAVADQLARARANEEAYFKDYGRKLPRGFADVFKNNDLRVNFLGLALTGAALGLHYGQAPINLDAYASVLKRSRDLVAGWGGTLELCYLPARYRYTGLFSAKPAFDVTRDRVIAAAEEHGIRVVDVTPAFERHPSPAALYASDGHFSIEGAALAAQVLAPRLPGPRLATGG